MTAWTLPAPGKLNLFLHITGRRSDGYHRLQTVFQLVDWADQLSFSRREDGVVDLRSNVAALVSEQNLVLRAARALQQETGMKLGADIYLDKQLPVGGGMGGGSSDAATTLCALNQLWSLDLSRHRLQQLGLQLGADVPLFVAGQSAWGEGIGECLEPMSLPERWYVLLVPNVAVSTAQLFSDARLCRNATPMRRSSYHLGDGMNVFTPLLREDYPALDAALLWLGQFADARVTGTGSVVFAAFDSHAEASRIAQQSSSAYETRVVKGLNSSPLCPLLL